MAPKDFRHEKFPCWFISCVTSLNVCLVSLPEVNDIISVAGKKSSQSHFSWADSTGNLVVERGIRTGTPYSTRILLQCLLMLWSTVLCLLERLE